jgi:hypothetical protein
VSKCTKAVLSAATGVSKSVVGMVSGSKSSPPGPPETPALLACAGPAGRRQHRPQDLVRPRRDQNSAADAREGHRRAVLAHGHLPCRPSQARRKSAGAEPPISKQTQFSRYPYPSPSPTPFGRADVARRERGRGDQAGLPHCTGGAHWRLDEHAPGLHPGNPSNRSAHGSLAGKRRRCASKVRILLANYNLYSVPFRRSSPMILNVYHREAA